MTVPHFGRHGRYSATNEEPAAGARKKQNPSQKLRLPTGAEGAFAIDQIV
jgi:hypothetical protein